MRRFFALLLGLWALALAGPAAAEVRISFHSFNGSVVVGRYPHAFVVFEGTLADGTRISVLRDWDSEGDGEKARFLRQTRDGACRAFSTVLSPEYNAAHADHFHLDMSSGWSGVCR